MLAALDLIGLAELIGLARLDLFDLAHLRICLLLSERLSRISFEYASQWSSVPWLCPLLISE
jgi:hypothetical protein